MCMRIGWAGWGGVLVASVGVVGPLDRLVKGRSGGPGGVYDEEAQGCPALLERIAGEPDAGLFMSAAMGLGALREAKAVSTIKKQLLRLEPNWSGVAPYLMTALMQIDRDAAKNTAKDLLRAGREKLPKSLLAQIDELLQ